MQFNCIIIDDEPLAIKIIENHLKKINNITVQGIFSNPIEALPILKKDTVDVVFLDINMPEINGMDFLKNIPIKSQIIITTAYKDYAVESYTLNVLDYLVKPISFSRFLKSVNKLIDRFYILEKKDLNQNLNQEQSLFLRLKKRKIRVKHNDILYIEGLKDYVRIYTTTANFISHQSLGNIIEQLPIKKFIRIHKSYVVALDKIKFIESNYLQIDYKKIPIGRTYKELIKEQFK